MHEKKTMVLAFASILACSLPLLAEEATSETAEPVGETAESPEAVTQRVDVPTPASIQKSIEEERESRWEVRNEHYQDLRQRAEKLGVMLPESPPWNRTGSMMRSRPDMEERQRRHEKMMSMTPEEREAARLEHYQEMREQAMQRGVELPETPPWKRRQQMMDETWAKHQAAIDGMSDEERAACHAMHQRHMGMMRDEGRGPMMRGPGMGRGMGPGYGYGPMPYGPQNFWDPNQ